MADTSDTTLAYAIDASDAALPAALSWQLLNFVSFDGAPQINTTQSKVIRPDASLKDVRRTGSSSAGTLAMELAADPEVYALLAMALRGAWVSNTLKAGVARTKIAIEEKSIGDSGAAYSRYRRSMLNGFTLAAADGLVDITFPLTGTTIEDDVVITNGGTYVQPGNAPVLAGVDFTGLTDSGLTVQLDVASINIDMTNNGRSDNKLGSQFARSTSWGKRTITITASLFFASNEAFQRFKSEAVRSVSFGFKDPGSTASIGFNFGRCRPTSYGKPIPGENQTIMVATEFTATYDPTSQTDFSITRTS